MKTIAAIATGIALVVGFTTNAIAQVRIGGDINIDRRGNIRGGDINLGLGRGAYPSAIPLVRPGYLAPLTFADPPPRHLYRYPGIAGNVFIVENVPVQQTGFVAVSAPTGQLFAVSRAYLEEMRYEHAEHWERHEVLTGPPPISRAEQLDNHRIATGAFGARR